jgi:hypothetical protein
MWGQWTGNLVEAEYQWHVILNIDRDRPNSGRLLSFLLNDPTFWKYATIRNVSVANSQVTGDVEFSPYPLDLPFDEQQQSEPTRVFHGTMRGKIDGKELCITLNTPGGPSGTNGKIVVGCVETDL